MKKISRWDPVKKRYEPHLILDDWNIKLYSDDMDEVVNCARCGKKIKYGESYTSRQIHNDFGFGYTVCPKCYEMEWEEEKEANAIHERID